MTAPWLTSWIRPRPRELAAELRAGLAGRGARRFGMADRGEKLARLLAAMAATPELDGLLLLDAPYEILQAASDQLSRLLRDADGREPHRIFLGAYLADDELWTRLVVRKDGTGHKYLWPEPGYLFQRAGDPVALVVVPDLARMSNVARRALVTLLDSPVAHLERHGQHLTWRPRLKWLVACESAAIGDVSLHVLDRFPVRFPLGRHAGIVGAAAVAAPLADGEAAREPTLPSFPTQALARASEYFSATGSVRREIALSRLARALAHLDGVPSVTAGYVDEAATVMGLAAPISKKTEPDKGTRPPASQQALWQQIIDFLRSPLAYSRPPDLARLRPTATTQASEVAESVSEPLTQADLPVAELSGVPYPEDELTDLTEVPGSAMPDQQAVARPAVWGPVIGIQATTEPRDLAWVPTLTEAAKFQAVRRRFGRGTTQRRAGLILSPTDLRAYRRSRRADALLVLVLDHTCLRHTDATGLLASYLYWAHTRRAAITVIEVGAAGVNADLELRAASRTGRSVQDPAVQLALRRPAGKATPLAHGLELARDCLQRAERASVAEAWLVIVTDGLGNVPLAASLAGSMRLPWAGRGIANAVAAASAIAEFQSVNAVVIAPPRVPHPELPARLAAAMGAGLIRGTPTLPVLTPVSQAETADAT